MIDTNIMYGCHCDNCGENWIDEEKGMAVFGDEMGILNEVRNFESWHTEGPFGSEKHYCPDCFKIGDNDELIIDATRTKPPVPAPSISAKEKAQVKFESFRKWSNGMTIKHIKNRSVTVIGNLNKDDDSVGIEFRRADFKSKEEVCASPIFFKTMYGKAQRTGVHISKEAALALYACLDDYFRRVDPLQSL